MRDITVNVIVWVDTGHIVDQLWLYSHLILHESSTKQQY